MSDDGHNIVYVIGLTLLLIGSLLLACFGSELAPSYAYTRSLDKVTCSITNSSIIGNVCCEADISSIGACSENYIYPCALVTIVVDSMGENGTLYKDYKSAAFKSSISSCSYFHCQQDTYADRLKEVTDFISTYTSGSEHTCYFGEKDELGNTAVLSRINTGSVIASILISCLIITAGVIMLIVMCVIAKLKKKNGVSVEKIPPSKENLKQGDEFEDHESDIETIRTNTTTVSVRSSTSKSNGGATPFDGSPEHHPNMPV